MENLNAGDLKPGVQILATDINATKEFPAVIVEPGITKEGMYDMTIISFTNVYNYARALQSNKLFYLSHTLLQVMKYGYHGPWRVERLLFQSIMLFQ